MLFSTAGVYAGSINGAESSVIAAAGGTFTYNGKQYVATSDSMGQLYAYLLSDDVDLTEEQASTAIGMMYDNISTGVEGGYLALIVDSSTPEDEGTDTGTEGIGGTDETEGIGGTGGTDEGKEETGDNRKPDFDREIDIPESLSPDVKAVFDEFFQMGQVNTGGPGVEQIIEKPSEDKDEGSMDMKDVPVAAWIAGAAGLLALLAVVFLMLRKPDMRKMKAMALKEKDNLKLADIHCHALYGLDDGAKNQEQSRAMIEMLRDEGVRTVIFTFHAGTKSSGKRIEKAEEHIEQLRKDYPDMRLFLGNEILNGSHMQKSLVEGRTLTLAGSSYVLVEFLPGTPYEDILQRVRHLVNGGYKPVIAHAERYNCLTGNKKNIQELVKMGAYIQINSRSFIGSMVDRRSRFTVDLMRSGLVHFIADDCHNDTSRKPVMGSVYMYLLKNKGIDKKILDTVFCHNPERILEDQTI